MSILTQASLIVTPNAVKEGKLYSIIPSNGNGDMTVVRATATATRTNELGLIEPTPYNLVTYSEMFADASWIKTNSATVTANTDISPNGTLTADRLTAGATSSQVQNTATVVSGGIYTVSIWIKRITGTGQVYLRSIENVNTPITITNDWVRYSLTTTATSSIGRIGVALQTSGDVVAIWGAQLVQGSVPKDYFYTTDRLNVPRLNYDSVGGCPSILVEPQRTNLLLNSVWTGGGTTPTSWFAGFQTGTSTPVTSIKNPNITAYTFITSATRQEFSQTFAIALNSVNCFSVYVESITTAIIVSQMLRIGPVGAGTGTTVFLKNNVVISSATNIEAGFTYSIVLTCTATDSFQFRVGSGVLSNTTGNFVLSMPQLELSSYSTSFIPTTIQATTRNADVISKTGISDLIGQTEGTLFCEFALNTSVNFQMDVRITAGTGNEIIIFNTGLRPTVNITSANVLIFSTGNALDNTSLGANNKIAVAYKNNDFAIYQNGVLKFSQSTGNVPLSLPDLLLSNGSRSYLLKNTMLFKTRLTNTELAQLTTL